MIEVQYRVTLTGGEQHEVVATAPDLMRFERHYNQRFTAFGRDNAGNIRWEWHGYVAWCALRRRKTGGVDWPAEFEAFLDMIEDVELWGATDDDDEDADPEAQSPGSPG